MSLLDSMNKTCFFKEQVFCYMAGQAQALEKKNVGDQLRENPETSFFGLSKLSNIVLLFHALLTYIHEIEELNIWQISFEFVIFIILYINTNFKGQIAYAITGISPSTRL